MFGKPFRNLHFSKQLIVCERLIRAIVEYFDSLIIGMAILARGQFLVISFYLVSHRFFYTFVIIIEIFFKRGLKSTFLIFLVIVIYTQNLPSPNINKVLLFMKKIWRVSPLRDLLTYLLI